MELGTRTHESSWDELARIQKLMSDKEPRNPVARRAMDEAYSTIVSEVQDHTPETLRRRFESLKRNRRCKYRDRQMIDRFLARNTDLLSRTGDPAELLEQRESLAVLLAAVTRGDAELLWSVATGWSYQELSVAARQPVGTLKSRVSRLRRRLRTDWGDHAAAA